MPATPAWLAAVEALLNRGIAASAQASASARSLAGRALRIDIEGVTSVRASIVAGRLALTPAAADAVDATISGSPLALLDLARSGGLNRGKRPAGLAPAEVSGDAEMANGFRRLFSAARPDWEDEFARLVGDLPARHLSQLVARAGAWARGAGRTAGANIAEYLQEESRDLVTATELDEFLRGVDSVREATDRLAARITRLEQRFKGRF